MRILLLGGYGNFGKLIACELARDSKLELIIAGRHPEKARALAAQLPTASDTRIEVAALDVDAPALGMHFAELRPDLVIHTSGPFQGREYSVASAALDAGAHYLDLADARAFVAGIDALNAKALARERLIVSGASSVPGLSAAVIDRHWSEFRQLDEIDIGISPGNRTPRGAATVAAILSYVGKPLRIWRSTQWHTAHGWQDMHRERYPEPVGARWLSLCDVPDLELFPRRYAGLRAMRFGAGLEVSPLHLGLWLLSWLVRLHLLPSLDRWTPAFHRISEWFGACGSDGGAMHVRLRGTGLDGRPLTLTWTLLAGSGDGPRIPAMAAVVLARKLARGEIVMRGAMPCIGLFTAEEYLSALAGYDIRTQVAREGE